MAEQPQASAFEARLRADIAAVRRGTVIMAVIGIILIVIVYAVLGNLVTAMEREMDPATLGQTVAGFAADGVPKVMAQMEQGLKEGAPGHVARLFSLAEEQTPQLRMKAEDAAVQMLGRVMDKLEGQMDAVIDNLLAHADKAKVQEAIQAALEAKPEDLEKYFTEMLEEDIGRTTDLVLKNDVYPMLDDVEKSLVRLSLDNSYLAPYEIEMKEQVSAILIVIDDTAKKSIGE